MDIMHAIKEFQKLAETKIMDMQTEIANSLQGYMAANATLLKMYVHLDSLLTDFIKETKVEKEKGYDMYFMPVLNRLFPTGSWSYSTLKKYRAIENAPERKNVFLGLADAVSEKSQKAVKTITAEQQFRSAVTRLNNLITEHKGKYRLAIKQGLLTLQAGNVDISGHKPASVRVK